MFIGLLSFNRSLAAKWMSLNNEACMTISTLIDLNPIKFNYYPFMISVDKCNGSCNNGVADLPAKVCVLSKTKSENVKVLNMIARINEAKTLVKNLSCDSKCI